MNKYMNEAIKEAYRGINKHHGGPFGTVIVKDNKIIAKAHNNVLKKYDPTAHGEIEAIRKASKKLKTYDLTGCILYTTGEPCHMCLCACLWANITKVYYGCNILENSNLGFRDNKFNNIFQGRKDLQDYLEQIDHDECLKLFNYFTEKVKKISY